MLSPQELIPGLPDEIGLQILAKASRRHHARSMNLVCTSWRDALHSPSLFEERTRVHGTEAWIYTAARRKEKDEPCTLAWFATTAKAPPTEQKAAWWPLPSMLGSHQPLHGFQSVAIGHFLYVLGGYHGSPSTAIHCEATNKVSVFNARTNRWSLAADMHHARGNFACGVINGLLYVAGGESRMEFGADDRFLAGDGYERESSLKSAEVFDPATGVWSLLPEMEYRKQLIIGTVSNGKLLVSGFYNQDYLQFEEINEMFDPKENRWKIADLATLQGNQEEEKMSLQGRKMGEGNGYGEEMSKAWDGLPVTLLGFVASFKLAWHGNELFIVDENMDLVCLRTGEKGEVSNLEVSKREMDNKKGTPLLCHILAV